MVIKNRGLKILAKTGAKFSTMLLFDSTSTLTVLDTSFMIYYTHKQNIGV